MKDNLNGMNVCCSHSWFSNVIVFRPLFGTCIIYLKNYAKYNIFEQLQINIECLKYIKVVFQSTNREQKFIVVSRGVV